MKITKAQALSTFREMWADAVLNSPRLRGDDVAKCESWGNYTDSLCKDGMISDKQYNTWSNPF
jgi:hypothetical protein